MNPEPIVVTFSYNNDGRKITSVATKYDVTLLCCSNILVVKADPATLEDFRQRGIAAFDGRLYNCYRTVGFMTGLYELWPLPRGTKIQSPPARLMVNRIFTRILK